MCSRKYLLTVDNLIIQNQTLKILLLSISIFIWSFRLDQISQPNKFFHVSFSLPPIFIGQLRLEQLHPGSPFPDTPLLDLKRLTPSQYCTSLTSIPVVLPTVTTDNAWIRGGSDQRERKVSPRFLKGGKGQDWNFPYLRTVSRVFVFNLLLYRFHFLHGVELA